MAFLIPLATSHFTVLVVPKYFLISFDFDALTRQEDFFACFLFACLQLKTSQVNTRDINSAIEVKHD